VTASVPDDRDNENAWTRRFVTEMEKLAGLLLKLKQSGDGAARAEMRVKLRIKVFDGS
jgi:hypothetical protein